MKRFACSLFSILLVVGVLFGVSAGQECPFGTCPQPVFPPPVLQTQQEVSVLNWFQKLTYASGISQTPDLDAEASKYKFRAVRITTGNSCGSGSLVGRSGDSIFILTNAHVATNRPGNVVNCEAALKDLSGTEKFKATVIEGAYSSRDTTDWALLKADADHMAGIDPIKLSIRMPDHSKPSYTWGCPRCEVPSGQVLKTVVGEGAVWKWLPNSIGGQSGSGVHQRGYQHGLLTWSYSAPGGGVGAGQYTANIYKQSKNQTSDSDPRPEGLMIPACQGQPQTNLIDGYAKAPGEKRFCEIGQAEPMTFRVYNPIEKSIGSGTFLDCDKVLTNIHVSGIWSEKENKHVAIPAIVEIDGHWYFSKVKSQVDDWVVLQLIGMPGKLTPLAFSKQDTTDRFVESGYVLDGFVRQSGVGDYPIWGDPDTSTPPPVDPPPVDPQPPTKPELSAESRKKLEDAAKLVDEVLKK